MKDDNSSRKKLLLRSLILTDQYKNEEINPHYFYILYERIYILTDLYGFSKLFYSSLLFLFKEIFF